MGQITLQGVRKSFGPVNIIKDANLDIENGSFVVFVGPSGCGKTTLLRLIAGLEDVTGGQILIDGKNVVDVPPAKRGLSMVFQSYALYPHMSVRGNIPFGLKMADKIVVLNAGRIEQYGSPLELYERPANLFVAGFIGSPKMNFVSGEAAGEPGVATLGIRPEHLKIGKEGEGWPGTVSVAEHLGSDTFLYFDAGKLGMLTARCIGEFNLKAGDRVRLVPEPDRLHQFEKDGGVIGP